MSVQEDVLNLFLNIISSKISNKNPKKPKKNPNGDSMVMLGFWVFEVEPPPPPYPTRKLAGRPYLSTDSVKRRRALTCIQLIKASEKLPFNHLAI